MFKKCKIQSMWNVEIAFWLWEDKMALEKPRRILNGKSLSAHIRSYIYFTLISSDRNAVRNAHETSSKPLPQIEGVGKESTRLRKLWWWLSILRSTSLKLAKKLMHNDDGCTNIWKSSSSSKLDMQLEWRGCGARNEQFLKEISRSWEWWTLQLKHYRAPERSGEVNLENLERWKRRRVICFGRE